MPQVIRAEILEDLNPPESISTPYGIVLDKFSSSAEFEADSEIERQLLKKNKIEGKWICSRAIAPDNTIVKLT